MDRIFVRKFDSPDERRPFVDKGHLDILKVGEGIVGLATFEPGWKWSEHVKPIAGTDTCETAHAAFIVSGRLHVVMDDGETHDLGPGDFAMVPPGHDAWVVGSEPCVMFDFAGAQHYAERGDERPVERRAMDELPSVH